MTPSPPVWLSAVGAVVAIAMDHLRDCGVTQVEIWSERAQRLLKSDGKKSSRSVHGAAQMIRDLATSRPVIIGVVAGVVTAFLLAQRKR